MRCGNGGRGIERAWKLCLWDSLKKGIDMDGGTLTHHMGKVQLLPSQGVLCPCPQAEKMGNT